MVSTLITTNHNRDIVGLTYIYPVLSRRAGGLSIGINFNTNNACNWRCIYCQVPDLTIGAAPEIDFQLLEKELRFFLAIVLHGDFYQRFQVPEHQQVIKDIAISGNGEPTSVKDFAEAIELIGRVATEFGVLPTSNYVLITNGSLVHQPKVQEGLKVLQTYGGEVWFKFDSATDEGLALINNTRQSCQTHLKNLLLASQCCPTKLQTCLVDYDGNGLSEKENSAFLQLLTAIKAENAGVQQVMLYTIARPSLQPEASLLAPLSVEVLNEFADDIRQLGFDVSVSV
ncbi:MAG: radical SAM protein [Methylococcales bacterium]|nr:radical SAM protein [Methylococcales bacterium]